MSAEIKVLILKTIKKNINLGTFKKNQLEKVAPPCPSVLLSLLCGRRSLPPRRCSVLRGGFVAPSAVFASCLVLSASVAPPFALRRSFPPSLSSPFCRFARSLSPPRGFAPAPPSAGGSVPRFSSAVGASFCLSVLRIKFRHVSLQGVPPAKEWRKFRKSKKRLLLQMLVLRDTIW